MNTTSLENAVEGLLDPSLLNPSDAQEEVVDENQDAEQQLSDDGEEYEDDVEASDDIDIEDATEYTDDVEAVDDDSESLFDVTIDGKQERWTLSQLKQSAAGQGYIQQKMRENAEAAKQLQEREAQLAQQQQTVLDYFNQLQQGGLTPPTPPSEDLLETDPIGYMQLEKAYNREVQEFNQKMAVAKQMKDQQDAAFRNQQMRLLQERIPEIADPNKSAKFVQDISTGAQQYYGVSQEMLGNVKTAVELEVLRDAIRYRKAMENRKNVDKKAVTAKPMIKAGTKKPQDGGAVTRKKQEKQAFARGDMGAMAAFLVNPKL